MADENIIKNPARNSDTEDTAGHSSYVPQYRIMGVSPEFIESSPEFIESSPEFIESSNKEKNSTSSNYFNIPNVGNNMEHAWTKIPNNSSSNFQLKNEDKYILLANEEVVLIGSLDAVQEEVRKIFYKEHSIKKYNDFNVEDLVVLKKMKIKIGVFVE